MSTAEQKLFEAVKSRDVVKVSSLLKDHPGLDVNWTNEEQWSALHMASYKDHADIVEVLLEHPHINVNLENDYGQTPFFLGCQCGKVGVVRVLLKDPRVLIAPKEHNKLTPQWWASFHGHRSVIAWLIASGRDLGDWNAVKGKDKGKKYTALDIARQHAHPDVALVLERFLANPTQIRHELRVEFGVVDEHAAELFALIVFLCDGLLQLNPAFTTANLITNPAAFRFFTMVKRLPMELQMIICHRAVGSAKDNILSKDSEVAFKSLVRALLLLPSQSD